MNMNFFSFNLLESDADSPPNNDGASTSQIETQVINFDFENFINHRIVGFTRIKDSGQILSKPDTYTIGFFHLLPDEIFVHLLKYLSIKDLSALALTNSKIRDFIIENFFLSKSGFQFLIRQFKDVYSISASDHTGVLDMFSLIGIFLKKCTFVFPTQTRINLLFNVIKQTYGIPSLNNFDYFEFSTFKIIFKCYACLISNLISGWGDYECATVYTQMKDAWEIDQLTDKFLKSSLGLKQKHEILIRHFYRMICSTSMDSAIPLNEKLCWLMKTLKNYSITNVAKILIVIFGPLISVNFATQSLPYLGWWDLTDSSFVSHGLEDFGYVIRTVYYQNKESKSSKQYILQVFDQIIHTPSRWLYENASILLYHSGGELTLEYLRKKLKDESINDVACHLCYLNIITHKLGRCLKSIIRLFDILIEEFGTQLIDEFTKVATNIVLDYDMLNDDDVAIHFDVADVVEAQIELMRLYMLNHFNQKQKQKQFK